MFSTSTRLHILLVLTVICVAFYIYSISREISVFQTELISLKSMVHSMAVNSRATNQNESYQSNHQVEEITKQQIIDNVKFHQDDDDVQSISSHEIKSIINNMTQFDSEIDNILQDEISITMIDDDKQEELESAINVSTVTVEKIVTPKESPKKLATKQVKKVTKTKKTAITNQQAANEMLNRSVAVPLEID
jgi:hypothetical protein